MQENLEIERRFFIDEQAPKSWHKCLSKSKIMQFYIDSSQIHLANEMIYYGSIELAHADEKSRLISTSENWTARIRYKDDTTILTLKGKRRKSTAMELEKEYNSKEREVMLYEWDFIIDNLDSYMSALLLEVFMIENKVNKDSIIDVYESFSNRIKVSDVGKNIADLLSQFEDPIEVGEIAPDFTAPSIDGPDITLSNVLLGNKVTLLDFWAAWCRPCRIENPNLVRLHKKYKDAGFDIIGVSLDRTREQWEQAVIDDNLPWTQVSNLNFWNDPVARRYSIRAIPQSFLINKEGVVIGKKGADIEWEKAMNLFSGVKDVTVAVIDTGLANDHPDLLDKKLPDMTSPHVPMPYKLLK